MDALSPGAGLWCLTIPRYLICTSHAYLPDCYSLTFIKRAPCTALAPPGRLGPQEVLEDLERHGGLVLRLAARARIISAKTS
jgi:hypothetical protein